MHWTRLCSLICVTVLTPACGSDTPPTPDAPFALSRNATMIDVVDGDTIDVSIAGHRERVRLIGIDTPETKKPDVPIQCFGPEASTFTKSLLPHDMPLHLERDVVARDDYGRLLAYVYRADDGEFVNLVVIRNGYARPLTIAPNSTHADEFGEAARVAEAGNVGLWGECSG